MQKIIKATDRYLGEIFMIVLVFAMSMAILGHIKISCIFICIALAMMFLQINRMGTAIWYIAKALSAECDCEICQTQRRLVKETMNAKYGKLGIKTGDDKNEDQDTK